MVSAVPVFLLRSRGQGHLGLLRQVIKLHVNLIPPPPVSTSTRPTRSRLITYGAAQIHFSALPNWPRLGLT